MKGDTTMAFFDELSKKVKDVAAVAADTAKDAADKAKDAAEVAKINDRRAGGQQAREGGTCRSRGRVRCQEVPHLRRGV